MTEIFDRLAAVYESPANRRFYHGTALRMAEGAFRFEELGSGSVCLDLACGTGISTEAAVSVFPDAEWFAVDQSSEMLAVAESKADLSRVRFFRSGAESLPFPDKTFDWVLCNVAYHWLPLTAREEIFRVLRPAGRLSMMVPLVAPAGGLRGNDWLGRVLMRFAKAVTTRRSQGLTLPQLKEEMKNFLIDRAEILDIDELFASERELMAALESRSSLAAIFGEHAVEVTQRLEQEQRPSDGVLPFRWKIAFFEARRQ